MTSFESLWGQTATQPPLRKKKKTFEEMWGEADDEGGLWESTKEVASSAYGAIPEPIQEGLESVGGGMMEVLHQLGRPQSAIAGGLYNIFEERQAGDQPGDERSNWEKYVNETLEGMKKGFTYEDEKRIQDIMAMADPQWVAEHPVLSTTLGFAGDMATDPLNLIGFGWMRHALGGFGTASKLGKAIGKTATGQKLAEAADNPVLRALNVYTGDKKKARDLYMKMLDDIRGQKSIIGREQRLDSKRLKETAKRLGVSVDDLNRQILRETEGMAAMADVPANLTGEARTIAMREAGDMREMFGKIIGTEQSATRIAMGDEAFIPGSSIKEVGEGAATASPLGLERATELGLGRGLGEEAAKRPYLPHILSEAGEKELKKIAKHEYGSVENMRDAWRKNPSAIHRKVPGTVEDVNLQFGKDFFITDAATIKAVRQANHATQMSSRNFLKETAETLGRRADDAPPHWVTIDGIEGVKFDPKLAPMIDDMHKTISDPKKLGAFLKFTDGATRWWKMWSLGLRPAYHARNVVGNLWNAYNIGGMSPTSFRRFAQAGKIQRQGQRLKEFSGTTNLGKFKNAEGKSTVSNKELWEMAQKDGVLNHGQYGADVGRNLERYAIEDAPKSAIASLGQWVTPTTKNKLLHGGFATGTTLENNTRLALYIDTLARTGSRKAARANVKKSLFDYADLSPFEQNVMKRFVPFYTWSRKNIPAQIEALIKNPQRGVRVDHLIDNIQYGIDTPSLDEMNDFISNRNPVFIDKFLEGGKGDVHKVITLMNWLPLVDPDRLLDWKPIRGGKLEGSGIPFPSLLAEMTNPYLKSVFEGLANYDVYRRRDIDDLGGKNVDFMGVRMPAHLAKLAQNLVMLSELDRLNPAGVFGEKTRDAEGKVTRTRARFKVPWQDKASLRESRLDAPVSMRILQYLVGLRPYEESGDSAKWDKLRLMSDYRELRRRLKKELGKGNLDTADDIRRMLLDMRRTAGE